MVVNLISVEVDARRSAEEEVARLLAQPADLKRLQSYRDDQAAKQKVVRQQLSAIISHQVEGVSSGLELLDKAQRAILRMKDAFERINSLCNECNNVIQHHDKIQSLAGVHYNITKTLQYAQHIADLPEQAREAELMLEDDTQLLQVYEVLSVLQCTSIKAQGALQAGARMSAKQSENFDRYFNQVAASFNRFEERLWSIIRSFMDMGQDSPWLLTSAVRVVEAQEMVDKQLHSAMEVGLSPVVQPRNYRKRCEQVIGNKLDDRFASLQQKCSQLAGAGEGTKEYVTMILEEADAYVAELPLIYDHVAPCFPPKYAIFDIIRREYQKQISSMLDFIGVCADHLANEDILEVIGWVERYLATLENLGVDERESALPDEPHNGMPLLIGKYMERTASTLHMWNARNIQEDMRKEPKETSEGRAYTPGVTELYRILNEHLALLEPVSRGDFLLRIAEVLLEGMRDYQSQLRDAVDGLGMGDVGDMFLTCGVVNNMNRCFLLALDFKDDIEGLLADECKGRLNMDKEAHGFVHLAWHAMNRLVDGLFAIPEFSELFRQLFCTDSWYDRNVTASVTATLYEYFFDSTSYWMDPSNFEYLCEITLERTVTYYTAAALHCIKAPTPDLVAGLQADIQDLDQFFVQYIKPDVVALNLQQLVDLRALLSVDGSDAMLLAYTSLLQTCPGISPAMLEKWVYARPELSKAEMRQTVEQCREVYIDRQRGLLAEDAAKLKPGPKETGFQRALVAARRVGGTGPPA